MAQTQTEPCPGAVGAVPLELAPPPSPHFPRPPWLACALTHTPPPVPAPSLLLNNRPQEALVRDTTLSQKPGMPWIIELHRDKGHFPL